MRSRDNRYIGLRTTKFMAVRENSQSDSPLKCQRCLSGEVARYMVRSDVIHVPVCEACAEAARKLALTVTPIDPSRHAA